MRKCPHRLQREKCMMAYQSGFVVSVLQNNKPIREFNNCGERVARIPFDSEYKLRLKNKTKVRALVEIDIDGTDILDGSRLILKAGDTVDLERFVDDSYEGRKFKFMSLEKGAAIGKIQDPTSVDNGLIEVRFYKEKQAVLKRIRSPLRGGMAINFCKVSSTNSGHSTISNSSEPNINHTLSAKCLDGYEGNDLSEIQERANFSNAGATVEGGKSIQQFHIYQEHFDIEGTPEIIRIKLKGQTWKEVIFGLYLNTDNIPQKTFNSREDAFTWAKLNDYGEASITIRQV